MRSYIVFAMTRFAVCSDVGTTSDGERREAYQEPSAWQVLFVRIVQMQYLGLSCSAPTCRFAVLAISGSRDTLSAVQLKYTPTFVLVVILREIRSMAWQRAPSFSPKSLYLPNTIAV